MAGHEVELRAVTGDQSAVPYATGMLPGHGLREPGYRRFIQQPLRSRPPAPEPLLGSVLSRDRQGAIFSLEGTVNGAGSAVSWFCAREQCDEDALWPALEGLPDSVDLPVFLNGVGGLGSPWWRVQRESRFVGEADSGGPLLRFAALVESVAFMIAVNAAELARQAGTPRRVVLAGGMSRSGWLGRRLAALIQLPVEVIDSEASARGVAQLAAPELTSSWLRAPLHCHQPQRDQKLHSRFRQFTDLIAGAS